MSKPNKHSLAPNCPFGCPSLDNQAKAWDALIKKLEALVARMTEDADRNATTYTHALNLKRIISDSK